jgi:hypothetical protein
MMTAIQKVEEKPIEVEVVQARPAGLALRGDTFEDLRRQAVALSPSSLIPKHLRSQSKEETLANVTLVLAYGAELGLGAVASLSGIAVVNGRPFAESQTLAAAVRASGLCLYLRRSECAQGKVTWETHRRGDPAPESRTFTWEMAGKAGLNGRDTYKAHPERMLSARALGWLLRDVYPDVVKGVGSDAEREDEALRYAAPAVPAGVAGAKSVVKAHLEAKTASADSSEIAQWEPDATEKAAILAKENEPGSDG